MCRSGSPGRSLGAATATDMPDIKNVKVGQTLYTVRREQAGNTTMRRTAIHSVTVKEIDPQLRWVMASWNYNPAQKFYARHVRQWKVKDPRKRGPAQPRVHADQGQDAKARVETKTPDWT